MNRLIELALFNKRTTIAALVQARPGASPTGIDLEAYCRGHVAGYKVPRELYLIDAIVRHPSGKPDYRWAKATAIECGGSATAAATN